MKIKFIVLAFILLFVNEGFCGEIWVDGESNFGHQVQEEGLNLPQQPILSFEGSGISAANSGSKTIVTVDGTFSGDILISDDTPKAVWYDSDSNVSYGFHLDTADPSYPNFTLWRGTGTELQVGDNFPLLRFDNSNNLYINNSLYDPWSIATDQTSLTGDKSGSFDLTTTGYGEFDAGILSVGTTTGYTIPSGAGTRLMWIPSKGAFRVGTALDTEWNSANIGDYSFGFGYEAKAGGLYSFAAGLTSEARGEGSYALGDYSLAAGLYSMAIGKGAMASGTQSIAIGNVTAAGDASIVVGDAYSDNTPYAFTVGFNYSNVGMVFRALETGLVTIPITLTIGVDKTSGTANIAGNFKLISAGNNAFYTTFITGTQTANVAYTLPLAVGAVNTVLTDKLGNGILSWEAGGGGGGGYTDLTQFKEQTPWRVFYSNADGDVIEKALGADGTYLKSNGAASAPTFDTPTVGSTVLDVVTKTSAYTATTVDDVILVSGTTTITLYTAVSNTGRVLYIKNLNTSNAVITIDADGSETIEGSLTKISTMPNENIMLVCDGVGWRIL